MRIVKTQELPVTKFRKEPVTVQTYELANNFLFDVVIRADSIATVYASTHVCEHASVETAEMLLEHLGQMDLVFGNSGGIDFGKVEAAVSDWQQSIKSQTA